MQTPAPFRLDPVALGAAQDGFNRRGEIVWFGFAGRFADGGVAAISSGPAHPGQRGGGNTPAINGGVIAAGFDAVSVLVGLGHYPTDVVVTLDLAVQFLRLAPASENLAWRGWATRTTRDLCFVQAALGDGREVFATATALVKAQVPKA
jgi:acyl-coenzyme A thioesterase PaaI-like protein